ncbi:MAG: GDP-mannose 4,6-dehydratase [Planctomycetia bacterium]|nr:GDP-mannose 4,6-dehydratase [Planctomycetia bacterium]
MKKLYFVTGCAGFIASRTVRLLLDAGNLVVGVDNMNNAYDIRMKEWRREQLRKFPEFIFYEMDVADYENLSSVFHQGLLEMKNRFSGECPDHYSGIFHLAARAGVRYSVKNPWVYCQTNILGTLNLLEICRQREISKFVMASSSSVYGNTPATHQGISFSEDFPTDFPCSPYAATKKSAETLAFSYHHLHHLDISVLRFFTVYGPAGRPDMSVLRFIRGMMEKEPILLYGDGSQSRDFTYVEDIARGVIQALKPCGYSVFNLGGDRPHSVNTLLQMISELTGNAPIIERKTAHRADVDMTWADITRAKTLLEWKPEVSLKDGLTRTVEWYMENRDWMKTLNMD